MHVLVVEDDPAIAEMLTRGLQAEDFQVDLCQDGQDALWRASETTYAAIVLDLLLPIVNGWEVCRRLRDSGNDTPILVLTAKSGNLDQIDLLELGADDFLTKPAPYDVLVARLRALIRRTSGQTTNQLVVGSLRLDQVTRECFVDGQPIQLTPRERAVLEVLMAAAGAPVSKQEVLRQVWGMDFEGEPNIFDVYLGRLRMKVGTELIQTVRGVGYRMSADG